MHADPIHRNYPTMVQWIGAFKLLEGIALLLVAFGLHKLVDPGVYAMVSEWVSAFQVDPHSRHLYWVLAKLQSIDQRQLKALSVGSFSYSALHLLEGTGLLLRQFWAEYLTVLTTGGLIPLEIYELSRRFTFARVTIFVVNVGVVIYLIINIRYKRSAWRLATD